MTLNDLKDYTKWLATWLAIGIIAMMLIGTLPLCKDDTDENGWLGERSGMIPLTDHLTGCQYLRVNGGGITPRLSANGHHLGCNQ